MADEEDFDEDDDIEEGDGLDGLSAKKFSGKKMVIAAVAAVVLIGGGGAAFLMMGGDDEDHGEAARRASARRDRKIMAKPVMKPLRAKRCNRWCSTTYRKCL